MCKYKYENSEHFQFGNKMQTACWMVFLNLQIRRERDTDGLLEGFRLHPLGLHSLTKITTQYKVNGGTRSYPTKLHEENRLHIAYQILGTTEIIQIFTLERKREIYAVMYIWSIRRALSQILALKFTTTAKRGNVAWRKISQRHLQV